MAITFPRDLPSVLRVPGESFRLERFMQTNRFRGGSDDVIEVADPRWRLSWSLGDVDDATYQELEAFFESLIGGAREFLAYRRNRPRPRLYRSGFSGESRHGGGAFDGSATVTALSATQVTLATLPSAFALKAGDMVGLVEDGRYGLHMALEDATAVGGVVTLTVEPKIKTNLFSTSATAQFDRPKAKMILTDWNGERAHERLPMTIDAYQRLT
jgi:hypothetical protein